MINKKLLGIVAIFFTTALIVSLTVIFGVKQQNKNTNLTDSTTLLNGFTNISLTALNLGYFQSNSIARSVCSNLISKDFTPFENDIKAYLRNQPTINESISNIFINYTCK